MDRKVLLGSVCAVALTAAMGTGVNTASAQVADIYGGGASLPAFVARVIFNCYSFELLSTPLPGDPDFSCGGGGNPNDGDFAGTRVFPTIYIGYATVGSTRGREGFIAEDSRVLSRGNRPSGGVTVPYASGAGVANNLPAGRLAFDDDDTDNNNSSTVDGGTVEGYGYDPSPLGSTTPTANEDFWTLHYTTSEEPILQVNAGNPQQSYDCYEGNAVDNRQQDACIRDKTVTNGTPLQVPLLAVGVTIAYNDDLTEGLLGDAAGRPVVDRATGDFDLNNRLRISEAAACALFNGLIDTWDEPAISGSFGNPLLPAEPVTVVVRDDGSGTSFVFSSWLDRICDGKRGALFTGGQDGSPDWNDNTGIFRASGNEGVASVVAATPYAVGYITPNLTDISQDDLVVAAGGFQAAEEPLEVGDCPDATNPDCVQDVTFFTIASGTFPSPIAARVANRFGQFVIPDPLRVRTTIFQTTNPPSCGVVLGGGPTGQNIIAAGQDCLEPENWGDAFTEDSIDPQGSASFYPINGFNWLNLYECYQSPVVAGALTNFLDRYYISEFAEYRKVLEANGFSPIPPDWQQAVVNITNAANTRVGGVGSASLNFECVGKLGAGRGFQTSN